MPIDRMPRRWQPFLYRLRRWLLSDASALLVVAYSGLGHALAYTWLHTEISHPAERYMALSWWAVAWALSAVLGVAGAVWYRTRVSSAAVGLGVGLHSLWALSHLGGAVTGDFARGYVGFVIYSGMVLVLFWSLWRGYRTEIVLRQVGGGTVGDGGN